MNKITGTIKEIIKDLNSGFISSKGLEDVFFSPKTEFIGVSHKDLTVGQKIEFNFIETERGLFAKSVSQITRPTINKRSPEASV